MAKRGQPAWLPTPDQEALACQMARAGITYEQIATVLGVCRQTLRKTLEQKLDAARAVANVQVANSLYQSAVSGVVPSMIFWLKCRAGWREQQPTESEDTQTTIVFNRGELPERLKTIEHKTENDSE